MTVLESTAGCFAHDAFVYASDRDYVTTLAPLMTAASHAGDAVIAVVPEERAALLRTALGPVADDVTWIDARDWYRRPVRTIADYERTLRALDPGSTAFVVGEVQFGATERDWLAWTRYESALNRALDRHAVRVICPYDARALPPSVIEDARRTHRHLVEGAGRWASDDYVEPESLLPHLAGADPADAPPGEPDVELEVGTSIREGRQAFAAAAAAWGVAAARVLELSVAVSEVLTNAVVHGDGTARMRIWRRDDSLTCIVEDRGAGTDDALLGYVPPLPGSLGGYGLWLTRQLFDRTELARSPRGGLLVLLAVDA